jgi:hypothetical protein
MEANQRWLVNKIVEFISLVKHCLDSTTVEVDRKLFAQDIEVAEGWLVRLDLGNRYDEVSAEILSSQTGKQFGDYWKQSPYGDLEMDALESLRAAIRDRR